MRRGLANRNAFKRRLKCPNSMSGIAMKRGNYSHCIGYHSGCYDNHKCMWRNSILGTSTPLPPHQQQDSHCDCSASFLMQWPLASCSHVCAFASLIFTCSIWHCIQIANEIISLLFHWLTQRWHKCDFVTYRWIDELFLPWIQHAISFVCHMPNYFS